LHPSRALTLTYVQAFSSDVPLVIVPYLPAGHGVQIGFPVPEAYVPAEQIVHSAREAAVAWELDLPAGQDLLREQRGGGGSMGASVCLCVWAGKGEGRGAGGPARGRLVCVWGGGGRKGRWTQGPKGRTRRR
jgi:hypothetical protein